MHYFYHDDGGEAFLLQNVGNHIQDHMASQPRGPKSPPPFPLKSKIPLEIKLQISMRFYFMLCIQ
jgi:hypothetical protein